MGRLRRLCLVAAALCLPAAAAVPQQRSSALPGDGGWDYVAYDSSADRVFIGRADGVQVVAAGDGRLLGTIGAASGDHGVALAPGADRVFTSDGHDQQLGVFALATLRRIGAVKLPGEPDGLLTDTATGHVLALLPERQAVVAVDPATAAVTATLDIGGGPEAGVPDGHGAVFVTIPDPAQLVRIDTRTMTVGARWAMPCQRPMPVAIDAVAHRLFVGCRDRRLLVIDADGGRQVAEMPIGEATDAVTFDPRSHRIAVASGAGGVALIHEETPDRYVAAGTIDTPPGARTMALDPAGGRLFTVTADIASIEPATAARPYRRLHTKPGTFRLLTLAPPP